MPLDSLTFNDSKHPPLFCIVVQRTLILPSDECHCFITKNSEAALTLVRIISQVYANLNIKSGTRCLKSPIFYQVKIKSSIFVLYLYLFLLFIVRSFWKKIK